MNVPGIPYLSWVKNNGIILELSEELKGLSDKKLAELKKAGGEERKNLKRGVVLIDRGQKFARIFEFEGF